MIWGFDGTRYARFAEFGRAPAELPSYLPKLLQLRPKAYLGHNPLGVPAMFAMIAVLAMVLYSGVYPGNLTRA